MTEEADRWPALLAEVDQDLRRWRRAHPAATMTAIEAALNGRLRELRAGAAAALAVEWGRPPRAIPVPQLQEVLVRQGAYLGERIDAEMARR